MTKELWLIAPFQSLKQIRLERGISQKALAEEVGIGRDRYSKIENCKDGFCTIDEFVRICRALNLDTTVEFRSVLNNKIKAFNDLQVKCDELNETVNEQDEEIVLLQKELGDQDIRNLRVSAEFDKKEEEIENLKKENVELQTLLANQKDEWFHVYGMWAKEKKEKDELLGNTSSQTRRSLPAVKPDGTPYIYAVDFDGTLSLEAEWPHIGVPNKALFKALKNAQTNGAKIILWTNRLGEELQDAISWCEKMGLHFDAVNDDVEQIKKAWNYVTGRKIYADYYIDDHNMEVFR